MEQPIGGRIPPHHEVAEKSVLGSMLQDHQAVLLAQELLHEDDFYDPANREIFSAMLHLSAMSRPVDLVTVDEELTRRGRLEGCLLYTSYTPKKKHFGVISHSVTLSVQGATRITALQYMRVYTFQAHQSPFCAPVSAQPRLSPSSMYSMESLSAMKLASMTLEETPTVLHR